jgi:ankyrin repeat protein
MLVIYESEYKNEMKTSAYQPTTLLQIAARREVGSVDVVKVLLESGVEIPQDPSGPNKVLYAALSYFSRAPTESRQLEAIMNDGPGGVVKMLLHRLPNERADDRLYGELLQFAIALYDMDFIELLIRRGAGVNLICGHYGTALQCAAHFGHLDIIQLLLRSEAEVNILGGKYDTALRAAVVSGKEATVDALIAAGADANLMVSKDGSREQGPKPILYLALELKNRPILQRLLVAGAEVNLDVENRLRALTLAVESGDESVVQLLVDNGAAIHAPGRKFPNTNYLQDNIASALHMACSKGHEVVAKLLIDCGADVNLEVKDSTYKEHTTRTPLQVAACKGFLSIVKLLVLSGAEIDSCNCHGTALTNAVEENQVAVIKELLASGASIGIRSSISNALVTACKSRNRQVIELLVEELAGTPPAEAIFIDALASAASTGDDRIFNFLLDCGVPISSATLSQACGASLHASILALLDRGVDVNGDIGDGGRPIHLAAFQQCYAIVDLLLSCGADANVDTMKYGTPLQALTEGFAYSLCYDLGLPPEHGDNKENWSRADYEWYKKNAGGKSIEKLDEFEAVALSLIDRQENMTTEERSFGTPLHLMAFCGSAVCVEALLANGANVNATSGHFETPLNAALKGNKDAVVEILLRNDADPNHFSSNKGSPLHHACKNRNLNAVKMLLQHGADVNAESDSHSTPFSETISASYLYGSYESFKANLQRIIELLLQQDQFRVQEFDLISAAQSYDASIILPLLLDHKSAPKISEFVLVSVIKKFYDPIPALELFFQHDASLAVTPAMIVEVKTREVMKYLLNRQKICPITSEILYSAGRGNRELLEMLIDHEGDVSVTEDLLATVLRCTYDSRSLTSRRDRNMIVDLLERDTDLQITETMLKTCVGSEDMEILLERVVGMRITPEILVAASKTFRGAQDLVPLLLEHDKTVQVPQEVPSLEYQSNRHKVVKFMTVVLERSSDLAISAELLTGIFSDSALRCDVQQEIAELLFQYEKKVVFSDKLRKAIDEGFNDSPSVRDMLYKLEDTSVLPTEGNDD